MDKKKEKHTKLATAVLKRKQDQKNAVYERPKLQDQDPVVQEVVRRIGRENEKEKETGLEKAIRENNELVRKNMEEKRKGKTKKSFLESIKDKFSSNKE